MRIHAAGKNNPESFVADFAVFDPTTGVSKPLAPLQQARGNAEMVATDDGRLMVLGGRAFLNDEAIVRDDMWSVRRVQVEARGQGRGRGMAGLGRG